MTDSIFVRCANCNETIDHVTQITPGFYRKFTCSHCHQVTVVAIDKEGVVRMVNEIPTGHHGPKKKKLVV